MSQTFDYKILEDRNTWDLQKKVVEAINSGWEPQGGVAVHISGFKDYCFQAMVKRK